MFNDVQHSFGASCAMKKSSLAANRTPSPANTCWKCFDRVAVDCAGPLPTVGNRYLVVFSDYLIKWPKCLTVDPTIDAMSLPNCSLMRLSAYHEPFPSDHCQNFLSKPLIEICRLVNSEKVYSSSYRPQTERQTDGLVGVPEWSVWTLVQYLSMYVSSGSECLGLQWLTNFPFRRTHIKAKDC